MALEDEVGAAYGNPLIKRQGKRTQLANELRALGPTWEDALDAGAQWGRGAQARAGELTSPSNWAGALQALPDPREVIAQGGDPNDPAAQEKLIGLGMDMGPMGLGTIGKKLGKKIASMTDKEPRPVNAPKEIDLPKRYQSGAKEGYYRGSEAFGGITPQQLGHMRMSYLKDALEGEAHSKYWYDHTSKDISRITGGDQAMGNVYTDMAAVTSAGTDVMTNTAFANKGWNQNLVGEPVKTGRFPNAQGARIDKAVAGEGIGGGMKIDPFAGGLRVDWAPNPNLRPVHDIHDVRAWGIVDPKTGEPWSKGVSEAGHRFLDEQQKWVVEKLNAHARKNGKPEDWNAYRAQAAAWSPQRVRAGKAKDLTDAAKHYGDFMDEYSALISREHEPGFNTGHHQEIFTKPQETRQAYADALERTVTGPQGIDNLGHKMGAITDVSLPNRGVYEGAVTPGYTSRIGVGKVTGEHGLDPASERVVNAVAGAHGLIGVQRQMASNFLSGNSPIKNFSGAVLDRGKPLSPAELESIGPRLQSVGLDIPQVDPRGARVLNFSNASTTPLPKGVAGPPDLRRVAQAKMLRDMGAELGGSAQLRERSGSLFPETAPDNWSSKPFIEAIEGGGPKMVAGFDAAMKGGMAAERLQVVDQLAKEHGLTNAPYYRPMMEALRDGGLAKLKTLVAKGVVPVSAFAFIASQLGDGGNEGVQ